MLLISKVEHMRQSKEFAKCKVLRRVAPVIFLAAAGVGLAACGSGGGGSNNASYEAGFRASFAYSGINLGGSNASYTCGELWTQASGNYNQSDWMSGCEDGINS